MNQNVKLIAIPTSLIGAAMVCISLWNTYQNASFNPDTISPVGAVSLQASNDVSALASQHWFGVDPDDQMAASGAAFLNGLQLKGVSMSPDPATSGAYIAEKGQPEQFYRVGDAVGAAGTLAQVLADQVIIRSSDANASLTLSDAVALQPASEVKDEALEIVPAGGNTPFVLLPPEKEKEIQ